MKPVDMNYTLYGKSTFEELKQTFLTFYSREDFIFKLREFSQVHAEEYASKRTPLVELFRSRNLDFNAYEKASQQEQVEILRKIPNREELVVDFIKKIYEDFYLAFPESTDFWNRLLSRHAPKVFDDNDSLRLKILKILQTVDFYQNDFDALGITSGQTLTENIFLKLFDLADYVNWVIQRLNRNQAEKFLLTKVTSFKASANLSAANPGNEEKKFFKFLTDLYDISQEEPIRCDRHYLNLKINLILKEGNCLEALPCLGKSFFTVREYVSFFLYLLSTDESFNGFDLDLRDKRALIDSFGLNFNFAPADRVSDILSYIADSKEEFNNGRNRNALLESIEEKLFAVVKNQNSFKKIKAKLLLELHRDEISVYLRKYANLIIGKPCGLSFDTWKDFFLGEVKRRSFKFYFSGNVVQELERHLGSPLPRDITLIDVLNNQIQNLQQPGIEKTGIKIHNEIVEFLRQFTKQRNLLRRAWDAHVRNKVGVLKTADDLSKMRIRSQRATKVDFYRFALLLDLNDKKLTPDKIFEKILDDIYTDNFFAFADSNFSPEVTVLSEGINWKNYAETIYMYYLCRQDLTPSVRLTRAVNLIQICKKNAKNLPNPGNPVDLTKIFHDRFNNARRLSENDFRQYLLDNYYIYDPDENENLPPIMMASQMNSAFNVFNDLRGLIENWLAENNTRQDLDAGVHLEDFLENLRYEIESLTYIQSDKGFVNFFKKLTYTLNIYERNLLNRLKDSETFSRTDLIALYYVYFANAQLPNFISSYEIVEWDALFNEFTGNLNVYLTQAEYKTWSYTTILDQFVLFSLYMKIINEHVHPVNC